MERKGEAKKKFNNGGSTLIIVLVAVSFLTVVASIVLSISSANLRMKQIEYQTKENFYVDEIGLDDIYNGIGKDVSNALSRAYAKTLIEATANGAYPTQKAAYIAFAGSFSNELKTLYGDAGEQSDATLAKLNSYITRNNEDEVMSVESYGGISIEGDSETGASMRSFTFKKVKVKYVENDTYESVITTDIVIEVPYINFFQDFTQVLDYALIGNKGIYFKGTECEIEGNVYAGTDSAENNATNMGYWYDTGVYDGINFYQATVTFNDSSYIVSRGDFNICESKVTINSKVSSATKEAQSNLWVENIRTVENGKNNGAFGTVTTGASLNATANIFAADDLELNARNSNVTLQGNYYGYNYNNSGSAVYNTYETNEKTNIGGKYTASAGTSAAAHTTSSAIIVNGNNSTLDLTGLNTLMVAGVAYVDIKDSSKSYAELSAGSAQEYRTGESIALRYNQFMYLAPDEILDGVSNPQLNGTTDAGAVCPSNGNEKLSKWFGREYLDISKDSPVIPVVYSDNGQSYTYYYLRLKEGQEENYVKSFMEVTDAGEEGNLFDKQKWELKQAMLKRAESSSIASHITVKADGTEGNTNIYTAGLLTDTKESSRTIQDNSITLSDMAVRSTNLQKHYLQMYVNLEPNSVQEIEPAKLSDAGYPLKNFLKLDNFNGVVNVNIADRAVENVKDASVWIMKASSADVNLSGNKKRGIILCDGDLTISGNGGSFEGLIIATGKITVTGNVTIKANSGVVQAVLEAEQRSVTQIAKSEADSVKLNEYASYYFINTVLADLISLDEGSLIDMDNRVTGTDYTDYIYYKNWQKGETG